MPFIFDAPQIIEATEAKITDIRIQVEPLTIVISYEVHDSTGKKLSHSTAVFLEGNLAEVDTDGTAYQTVKATCYELLKSKLGSGTIA